MKNKESMERSQVLTEIAVEIKEELDKVPTGLDQRQVNIYEKNKKIILGYLNATEDDWNNYHWQLDNKIDTIEKLEKYGKLLSDEINDLEKVSLKYRWSVSPYFLALIDWEDENDAIKKLSIPYKDELYHGGYTDPMCEEFTNPAGSVTRRYPDRLIVNVTNVCATYCRHCQRKRNIGETDVHSPIETINESIAYIKEHKEIRDVLITGGDPLTITTEELEVIVKGIREIEHVQIIRIGTRIPVTLPQRIDDELVNMLKKYHPLFINIQFNHPKEITKESKQACELLSNAGIPLGNQAVLLEGINNDKYIQMKLNQLLLLCRVKPYYLFHAKQVMGTMHFNASFREGLEIMNFLRGHTTGMAIPTYIINAPGGYGKIPITSKNIEYNDDGTVTLTTWEGRKIKYKETVSEKAVHDKGTMIEIIKETNNLLTETCMNNIEKLNDWLEENRSDYRITIMKDGSSSEIYDQMINIHSQNFYDSETNPNGYLIGLPDPKCCYLFLTDKDGNIVAYTAYTDEYQARFNDTDFVSDKEALVKGMVYINQLVYLTDIDGDKLGRLMFNIGNYVFSNDYTKSIWYVKVPYPKMDSFYTVEGAKKIGECIAKTNFKTQHIGYRSDCFEISLERYKNNIDAKKINL